LYSISYPKKALNISRITEKSELLFQLNPNPRNTPGSTFQKALQTLFEEF